MTIPTICGILSRGPTLLGGCSYCFDLFIGLRTFLNPDQGDEVMYTKRRWDMDGITDEMRNQNSNDIEKWRENSIMDPEWQNYMSIMSVMV